MSLLTICQAALKGMSGFAVPSTFYGNANLTATLAVAVANEEGQDLEKEHRWQELISEYTFSTVSGTATYALPTSSSSGGAFRAFANMTQWDRTNTWRLTGPIPPSIYQYLKSGISVFSTSNSFFIIRGGYFTLYPTPTSVRTIAFDYYTKGWITKQTDSTNISAWSSDSDTSRLDEDLIAAGVKWRFLQAKGMPFEPEYKRYESVKEMLISDNGARGTINMGRPIPLGDMGGNLPDSGFGS